MAPVKPRRRRRGWAAIAALAACHLGCNSGDLPAEVEGTLYDEIVICRDGGSSCVSAASGAAVTGEPLAVTGIMSGGASRWAPGIYLYASAVRPGGVFAELEIDLPADMGSGMRDVDSAYREYRDGAAVFAAQAVSGWISVAAPTGTDAPFTGYFELDYVDPGPDGIAGTPDDSARSLRSARFSVHGYEPDEPPRPPAEPTIGVHVEVGVDLTVASPDGWGSDGCEGDSAGHDQASASGCEGDTAADAGGGDGCEGDAPADPAGGSGCEGDAASGGSGCGGDAVSGGGGCGGDAGGCSVESGGGRRRVARRLPGALMPLLGMLATAAVLRRTPGRGGAPRKRPVDDQCS